MSDLVGNPNCWFCHAQAQISSSLPSSDSTGRFLSVLVGNPEDCVAKNKVTAQLVCVFVFAYADCWFSGMVVNRI